MQYIIIYFFRVNEILYECVMLYIVFTELGNHQHGRIDRKADIARDESVRGQLRW